MTYVREEDTRLNTLNVTTKEVNAQAITEYLSNDNTIRVLVEPFLTSL